jgi:hypothetical protein
MSDVEFHLFLAQVKPGVDGFLGTRGSIMLDVVFLAMFAVVPVLLLSIYLVKQGRYQLHKWIQITTGLVLLLAVTAFEVDMRLFTDWELRAAPSPYYTTPDQWNIVWYALVLHLCTAVPAPFLWAVVIVRALRRFPNPPQPGAHSPSHIRWAWIAAVCMVLTSVSGWVFYYLAFVAT